MINTSQVVAGTVAVLASIGIGANWAPRPKRNVGIWTFVILFISGMILVALGLSPLVGNRASVFKFIEPVDGAGVVDAFDVRGATPDLQSDTLWLFVLSAAPGHSMPVYYKTTDQAVNIANGGWSINHPPLGGPEDAGQIFIVAAVRANKNCTATINRLEPNTSIKKLG